MLTGAILLVAMPLAAAEPSTQFNLKCEGTLKTSSAFEQRTLPYTTVYRIDLTKLKWCEDDCRALFDIDSVHPTQITLKHKEVDTFSEKSWSANTIDRQTGEHSITISKTNPRDRADGLLLTWDGHCEREPFSGFPTFETKF